MHWIVYCHYQHAAPYISWFPSEMLSAPENSFCLGSHLSRNLSRIDSITRNSENFLHLTPFQKLLMRLTAVIRHHGRQCPRTYSCDSCDNCDSRKNGFRITYITGEKKECMPLLQGKINRVSVRSCDTKWACGSFSTPRCHFKNVVGASVDTLNTTSAPRWTSSSVWYCSDTDNFQLATSVRCRTWSSEKKLCIATARRMTWSLG